MVWWLGGGSIPWVQEACLTLLSLSNYTLLGLLNFRRSKSLLKKFTPSFATRGWPPAGRLAFSRLQNLTTACCEKQASGTQCGGSKKLEAQEVELIRKVGLIERFRSSKFSVFRCDSAPLLQRITLKKSSGYMKRRQRRNFYDLQTSLIQTQKEQLKRVPINYLFHSFDKMKFSCFTPCRHSTTVSLETNPLIHLLLHQ